MFDLFIEFYLRSFAVILPAMAIVVFAVNGKMAGLGFAQMGRLLVPLITLFGIWYALASALAKAGYLGMPQTFTDPPYILMFLFGSVGIFWAYVRFNSLARQVMDQTAQIFLIGMQIPRFMGGVFLIGWMAGVIPWQFALPAGIGDMWAGWAAMQATKALYNDTPDATKLVKRANIIGVLDFAVAIGTGFTSSEGFARLVAHGQINIITEYPTALFPAFFVPIFLAFHFFSIGKLRQASKG